MTDNDGSDQLQIAGDERESMDKQQFSLYVRGSAWIKDRDNAENRLKQIEPRIQGVRYPRQKSANYCFIDFKSESDRNQSFEVLKNHSEIKVKLSTKDVPKLLDKRRQKIADKRAAKLATKHLITKIKKNEQSVAVEKTNQIVLLNVPQQVTQIELKQKYPNAIRVNVKDNKRYTKRVRTAIITFANYRDACAVSKEESINLHGHKINVLLNTTKQFKDNAKKKRINGKTSSKRHEKTPTKVPKTEQ